MNKSFVCITILLPKIPLSQLYSRRWILATFYQTQHSRKLFRLVNNFWNNQTDWFQNDCFGNFEVSIKKSILPWGWATKLLFQVIQIFFLFSPDFLKQLICGGYFRPFTLWLQLLWWYYQWIISANWKQQRKRAFSFQFMCIWFYWLVYQKFHNWSLSPANAKH